ncbi:hypothetical protein MUN46_005400 [Mesosutterella sp. AGMB02718]|uniref:Uncharacterized protein n=1 Tax=Mesosutterella faecium TaxID=2925194 RepID=A0ABT7ILX6_9BURK|nr:hypothetical protein [Mesosutterella sp. AGMB02718]MDL2059366.1 hypothetical protein [Mesosutterella sp. AGMB02718]
MPGITDPKELEEFDRRHGRPGATLIIGGSASGGSETQPESASGKAGSPGEEAFQEAPSPGEYALSSRLTPQQRQEVTAARPASVGKRRP